MELPPRLARKYEAIDSDAVRSWSFGAVKRPRVRGAAGWEQAKDTLDDPRIFGPAHDFECACQKSIGQRFAGIICDRCGVKVTTRRQRRRRFGHINLASPIAHPFGAPGMVLHAVPVLPAAVLRSRDGSPLSPLYEQIVLANDGGNVPLVAQNFNLIIDRLIPLLLTLEGWRLDGARRIARGMALDRIGAAAGYFGASNPLAS